MKNTATNEPRRRQDGHDQLFGAFEDDGIHVVCTSARKTGIKVALVAGDVSSKARVVIRRDQPSCARVGVMKVGVGPTLL